MGIIKKYWSFLRRIRILHFLNNFFYYRKLKKNKLLYKRSGIDRSVVGSISHKEFKNPSKERPWLDKDNANEQLQNNPHLKDFSFEIQKELLRWHDDGYMILKGFVPEKVCDKISDDFEKFVQSGTVNYDYTKSRVMNLYKYSDSVKSVINNPQLISLLSFLLNKKISMFQTINFKYGSQQKTHSDSIHMTTEPIGYLLAIWVALEDLTSGCGLLHYYPGSHKLSYVMGEDFENDNGVFTVGENFYGNYEKKIADMIEEKKLKKEVFLARKGDLFIWHANLLHGGEKRTDNSTRKSLVAHYFTCEGDVINYHEITQRPAITN